MVKFDSNHTDWDVLMHWNGPNLPMRSSTQPENAWWKYSGHFMCYPETMAEFAEGMLAIWLCERHYKQAVKLGYIW